MANSAQHTSKKKLELRKKLRAARSQTAQEFANTATINLTAELKTLTPYQTAQKIAIYLPIGSEFPTSAILTDTNTLNKQIYIPYISDKQKHTMTFCLLQRDRQGNIQTELQENSYNIPEPKEFSKSSAIDEQSLDIIFMPLLGFNLQGDRLGMGGGYYDRALSFKNKTKSFCQPYLIGLAYEAQLTDELNAQPWDIKLDAVITEQQTYHFNSSLL